MMQASHGDDESSGRGSKLSGGLISTVSGVGLLAIFMGQNTEEVNVSFLFWDFSWPVWLLTLGAALLGALIWFGVGVLRRHRRRTGRREARRA